MNPHLTLQDLIVVAPMAALFFISLVPLLFKAIRGNRETNGLTTLVYNFTGLMLAAGLTAVLSGARITAFTDALVIDGFTTWVSYLVLFIAAVSLMIAYDNVSTRGHQFTEFCFLTMSSTVGMLILIMSNNLIVTFIGLEMMSLCLYILVAMSKEQVLSKEAAFKYFILGSFASAIFLYGISLLYGMVGSTAFPQVAEATKTMITTKPIFLIGMGLVILGFAFKVSIFPLHAWTPDVYQGASTPVTAFMSTAVKAATFVAFLRLFNSEGFAQSTALFNVMTWLAVLTMVVGNVAAIVQNNLKRVLAYSGIAHSGYAMIGLIAAGFGSQYQEAASSLLFYLFSYALMTVGAFALVALFEKSENTQVKVTDLKGLASRSPILAFSLSVIMLSLAGVPPTLGFFGKLYVFSAAVDQDMYWIAFWGVLSSAISVYYYLRPVVMMYMTDPNEEEVSVDAAALLPSRYLTRLAVVGSAVLIVVFGILASPVLRAVQTTVKGLLSVS